MKYCKLHDVEYDHECKWCNKRRRLMLFEEKEVPVPDRKGRQKMRVWRGSDGKWWTGKELAFLCGLNIPGMLNRMRTWGFRHKDILTEKLVQGGRGGGCSRDVSHIRDITPQYKVKVRGRGRNLAIDRPEGKYDYLAKP